MTSQLSPNITNYICAAAYLDGKFRQDVLNYYVNEKFRALTPSLDVEINKVLLSCLNANKIYKIENFILCLLLLLPLVAYGIKPVTMLQLAPHVNHFSGAVMFSVLLTMHSLRYNVFSMWHLLFSSIVQNVFAVSFTFLILFMTWWGGMKWPWVILLIATCITEYVKGYIVRKAILELSLHPDRVDSETDALAGVFEYARRVQAGNLILYNVGSPFEFSGTQVSAWSVVIPINKPANNNDQISSFGDTELYDHFTEQLNSLKHYKMESRLCAFIHSDDFKRINDLAPYSLVNRPPFLIDKTCSANFDSGKSIHEALHAFCCIDDLCLSTFITARHIDESYLFLEVDYRRLPLLNEHYIRYVESIRSHRSFYELLGSVSTSLSATPWKLIWSPIKIMTDLIGRLHRHILFQEDRRRIFHRDPSFDYGALPNIRQMIGTHEFRRFGQFKETDMFQKAINNILIDSLLKFLESRNIDVTHLKLDREKVINYGIIISDGDIKAQNLAIGKKAAAVSKIGSKKPRRKRSG